MTFLHPLVRSAVYRSASPHERRAVHLALAEVDRRRRPTRTAAPGISPPRRRARRGGRGGARAVGRTRAGARRARRGGGVPAPLGRADARSGATRRAGARRRAGQPARRRVRRGAGAAGAPPRRGSWTSSSVPGSICCTPSWPTPRTAGATRRRCCCAPRASSRRSTCGSRARPTSTRGAPRCSPGGLAGAGGLLDVSRAVASAPGAGARRRGRATCSWTASRSSFTDGPPGRDAGAAARLRRVRGRRGLGVEEMLRWGWLATAAAAYVWDLDTCLAARRPRRRARARGRARSRSWPSPPTCSPRPRRWPATSRGAAQLIAEADAVVQATGARRRPVRRARARRRSAGARRRRSR